MNDSRAQNILLTGGAGFIGSHTLQRLLARGARVVVLDSFNDFYDPEVKRRNLQEATVGSAQWELVEGDLCREDVLDQALARGPFDAVIHLAAWAGVRPSIQRPLLYERVNVQGTIQLLERMKKTPETRLVFASSSSVYGNNSKTPFSESDDIPRPVSPYAASKRAGELYVHTYHHLFGLHAACLRFFTVYGPRQRPEMAIHKFVRLIESGETIDVYGDGHSARDYTYIDDITNGILKALDACQGYEIYNLGNSKPLQLIDLVRAIGVALGKEPRIRHLPMQPGDVDITFADLEKSTRALGYVPEVPVEEGLARFVAWFRERAR